jgi:hypothetical protein
MKIQCTKCGFDVNQNLETQLGASTMNGCEAPARFQQSAREGRMRGIIGGIGIGLVVVLAAGVVGLADGQTPRPSMQDRAASSPELLALGHDGGDGRQQITLIDPRQRVMAVYTVDRATGALQLRSVRNVQWDLTIEDFNSTSPAPRDIRALVNQQR